MSVDYKDVRVVKNTYKGGAVMYETQVEYLVETVDGVEITDWRTSISFTSDGQYRNLGDALIAKDNLLNRIIVSTEVVE